MGLLDLFRPARRSQDRSVPSLSQPPMRSIARRSVSHYAAAKVDRLLADWNVGPLTSVESLRQSLPRLRHRSRQLARDNDHLRRFLAMVETNVVGPHGIRLQVRARNPDGALDRKGNDIVETSFQRWGQPGSCSMDGRLSWQDAQRFFIRQVARDGECFVRLIRSADNPWGFAFAFIDAERIDHDFNAELAGGRRVYMGIEVDAWFRATGYWVKSYEPFGGLQGGFRRERIDAADMIHAFLPEQEDQVRGVPWAASAMTRLKMLGAYEEAELVAARIGSSKMGFFYFEDGQGLVGDGADEQGNVIDEAEPGTFTQLPAGMKVETFDPEHPNAGFAAFEKAILRGIAAGLGVTYNGLANDLEGVNYSSIRQGALDERDGWRVIQRWMVGAFCQRIYEAWLGAALANLTFGISIERRAKFSLAQWQPRGWTWVDPAKETTAQVTAVQNGLRSRTQIMAEQGLDFEDTIAELAAEREIAKSYGITLADKVPTVVQPSRPGERR